MATALVLPKLGMTMLEGTITAWYHAHGDTVAPGDLLFAFETEKVDVDVEAEAEGTLHVAVGVDETVDAGAVVGYLLAAGEAPPAGDAPAAAATPPPPAAMTHATPANVAAAAPPSQAAAPAAPPGGRASPAVRRLAAEHGVDLAAVPGSGVGGRILREDVLAAASPAEPPATPAAPSGPIKASPAAKRIAAERGIDLATLAGSGPGGRVVVADVEAAGDAAQAAPPPTPAAATLSEDPLPYRGMRRTIGTRMHESLQSMAQLTMAMDVDMTRAVALRGELVELWEADGVRVTYTDFVIKAAALALRGHPRVNAALQENVVTVQPHVHVGFAVALHEGLIVPVTRHTDTTPLQDLARATADLAARARANQLMPDDLTGGTFTITSLGMYGVDVFTPIINPPQAAILGVGGIADRPVFAGPSGTDVERRAFLTLSLTIDHRILDGTPGADYLRTVKRILEHPSQLLLS